MRPKKKEKDGEAGEDLGATKARSARILLLAALVLSIISLGGGYFLAQMAFVSDAKDFEPEYAEVDSGQLEAVGGESEGLSGEASDAEDNGGENGKEEDDAGQEGVLEFADIVTNITAHSVGGAEQQSFLKLSVILVYRPDPGARTLVESRQMFMRDLFTTFVRSLTEQEVRGAAGMMIIKSELLKRARAATGNNIPQDVLIRDIVLQ